MLSHLLVLSLSSRIRERERKKDFHDSTRRSQVGFVEFRGADPREWTNHL